MNTKSLIENVLRRLIEGASHPPLDDSSFYYNDIVDDIVPKILEVVTKFSGNDILEYWEYSWPWETVTGSHDNFLNIDVEIRTESFDKKHPGWNIEGGAVSDKEEANIEITISLRENLILSPDVLQDLVPDLANTVAHEIHHLTQLGEFLAHPACPIIDKKQKFTTQHGYYASDCEIPAYVIGFRAESKYKNASFDKVARDYLSNQVKAGLLNNEEVADIIDKWSAHNTWTR